MLLAEYVSVFRFARASSRTLARVWRNGVTGVTSRYVHKIYNYPNPRKNDLRLCKSDSVNIIYCIIQNQQTKQKTANEGFIAALIDCALAHDCAVLCGKGAMHM